MTNAQLIVFSLVLVFVGSCTIGDFMTDEERLEEEVFNKRMEIKDLKEKLSVKEESEKNLLKELRKQYENCTIRKENCFNN